MPQCQTARISCRAFYGDATRLLLQELYLQFDEKVEQVVVKLDSCKAFDSVNHSCLLFKIASFGFETDSVTLNLRTTVKVESSLSDVLHVSNGVLQGNVLGPILC